MAEDGEDQAPDEQQPPSMDEEARDGENLDPADDDDHEEGFPEHMRAVKQLHNGNGYNLAISRNGEIYGTRERFHRDAITGENFIEIGELDLTHLPPVLEFSTNGPGEVRMRGKNAQMFVAMNEDGEVYAEEDPNAENTIWFERFQHGYSYYVWKQGCPEKEYLLGLKKSGKPKRGEKTRLGQKAVRFLPRSAYLNEH